MSRGPSLGDESGRPFDRWPTGSGFEHFYGFIAGETNQWYPALHEDVTPVEPRGTPEEGYHLMPDLTTSPSPGSSSKRC